LFFSQTLVSFSGNALANSQTIAKQTASKEYKEEKIEKNLRETNMPQRDNNDELSEEMQDLKKQNRSKRPEES
jgi:hypothetical protein